MTKDTCGVDLETIHTPEEPPPIVYVDDSQIFRPAAFIVEAVLRY
jgi:hypothetical protein